MCSKSLLSCGSQRFFASILGFLKSVGALLLNKQALLSMNHNYNSYQ